MHGSSLLVVRGVPAPQQNSFASCSWRVINNTSQSIASTTGWTRRSIRSWVCSMVRYWVSCWKPGRDLVETLDLLVKSGAVHRLIDEDSCLQRGTTVFSGAYLPWILTVPMRIRISTQEQRWTDGGGSRLLKSSSFTPLGQASSIIN